jgi:pimeloyl-ACP methyl ester carboxylesterase
MASMCAAPTTSIESSHGVRLAVYDLGGDGPAILFAHATGFCASIWGPVANHLQDRHCWALDFRCHGRSTRPEDDDLQWRGTADDVLAVIDELGLSGADGVGHSMGGAALLMAEQRRPGTFGHLWAFEPVVIPPGVLPDDPGSNSLATGAARRRDTFPSAKIAFDNFASKPPLNTFRPESLRAYIEGGFEPEADGSVRLRCRPADESRFYLMGGQHDTYEHLREVNCPVTIMRGTEDFGPYMFAPAVVERLPHGVLVDEPSLTHFGPMEDPELISASIRAGTT